MLAYPGDFGRLMTSMSLKRTCELEVVGILFDEVGIPTSGRNGLEVLLRKGCRMRLEILTALGSTHAAGQYYGGEAGRDSQTPSFLFTKVSHINCTAEALVPISAMRAASNVQGLPKSGCY
jgi:hypothetical protein